MLQCSQPVTIFRLRPVEYRISNFVRRNKLFTALFLTSVFAMITEDRRAFKRSNQKFTVQYKLHSAAGPYLGAAITENISLGGIYFLSFSQFSIGQLLDCLIKTSEQDNGSRWTARVVRCEPAEKHMVNMFGVAVEFVKSFDDSEKKLKLSLKK